MEILIICICFIGCFIAGGIISGGYKPQLDTKQTQIKHDQSQENRDLAALMGYFPDKDYDDGEVGI